MAGRRGNLALRARKVDALGVMQVIARGRSEDLAAFAGDLFHKQRDDGWQRVETEPTAEDAAALEGNGRAIVRTRDDVAGGADSSGRAPPVAFSDTSSIDTGSSASSRLVKDEVKRERERGDAALAKALARELAARETSIAALMLHAHMSRTEAEKALGLSE